MCIAVYKPQGQKMPSKKIFSNCFSSNDDGAGFMFPYNGKVHYEKGFMSFTAFKKGLKSAIKKYGIDTKDTPMVFHFRITSQGGVKPTLTHPFPLTRSYDEMRQLSGDVDVACVHNGIIDFASSYSTVIDYSDTMEFIKEVAYPLIHKNEDKYWKNKTLMGLLTYLLDSNRFAIMDKFGHTELIGNWIEDNGIFYSNSSYKSKFSFTRVKTTSTSLFDDFQPINKVYSPYRDDDDYDDFYYAGYISKDQEKELLETGMLRCPCGQEMVIEWLDKYGCCFASCYDCGMVYRLTLTAENYAFEHNLVFYDTDYGEVRDWNDSFGVKYEGAK